MSPKQDEQNPTRPGAVAADGDVEGAPESADLPNDPEMLRAQIDETRAELGDTVEALAGKADVKGQIKETVEDKKEQVRERQDQASAEIKKMGERAKDNPAPFAAAGAVALLVLVLLRRRGRR